MRSKDIRNLRTNLGRFLHDYYVKFGDEKYEEFLEELEDVLEKEYGEPFSKDNMRIMEAEFVTLSKRIKKNGKSEETSRITTKE